MHFNVSTHNNTYGWHMWLNMDTEVIVDIFSHSQVAMQEEN